MLFALVMLIWSGEQDYTQYEVNDYSTMAECLAAKASLTRTYDKYPDIELFCLESKYLKPKV